MEWRRKIGRRTWGPRADTSAALRSARAQLQLLSHQHKIATKIELFIGDGDSYDNAEWARLGESRRAPSWWRSRHPVRFARAAARQISRISLPRQQQRCRRRNCAAIVGVEVVAHRHRFGAGVMIEGRERATPGRVASLTSPELSLFLSRVRAHSRSLPLSLVTA